MWFSGGENLQDGGVITGVQPGDSRCQLEDDNHKLKAVDLEPCRPASGAIPKAISTIGFIGMNAVTNSVSLLQICGGASVTARVAVSLGPRSRVSSIFSTSGMVSNIF